MRLCHVAVSEVFLAGDIAECHYHPQEACFPHKEGASSSGGNWEAAGAGTESVLGYYPCCRKPACRYDCIGILIAVYFEAYPVLDVCMTDEPKLNWVET